jgi:hypothetical protein
MIRTSKYLAAAVMVLAACGTALANDTIMRDDESEREYSDLGMAGEPTGFTAKYWMGRASAIDLGAAWSLQNDDEFDIHADYLLHRFGWARDIEEEMEGGGLPLYFGLGAKVGLGRDNDGDGDDDTKVGMRLPLGVSWLNTTTQLEVFGEVVPGLDVAPNTELDFGAALGMRYTF